MNSRIRPTWASSMTPPIAAWTSSPEISPRRRLDPSSQPGDSGETRLARLLRALERLTHEHLLCRHGPLAAGRRDAGPGTLRPELPREPCVGEQGLVNLGDARLENRVLDRSEHLDPPVEVPRHQVRAADPRRDAVSGVEREDPAVLEEGAEHAADLDAFAESRHPRAQLADAARGRLDDDPCARGRVERLDDLRVDERVHFDADTCGLSLGGGAGDLPDLVQEAVAHEPGR